MRDQWGVGRLGADGELAKAWTCRARALYRARNQQYQTRKRREREFIPGFRHQAPGAFDAGAMS